MFLNNSNSFLSALSFLFCDYELLLSVDLVTSQQSVGGFFATGQSAAVTPTRQVWHATQTTK